MTHHASSQSSLTRLWSNHAHATRPELKADYARGFLTRGLFSWSRHPNFFAEQSMWWAFYLFAVAAKGGPAGGQDAWVQPYLAGPVLLSLLFQGSTSFTEGITAAKYPGACWPWQAESCQEARC